MLPDSLSPDIPDAYSPDWEREMVAGLLFAPAAETLLMNGRVEDARRLCEAGVVSHPWYATGHLLLGRAYLSESRWADARAELERALQLDGNYPALLEALAACYEQLGLGDLAQECRSLGWDLDPHPDMTLQEAPQTEPDTAALVPGGTEMSEVPEKTPESPEEPDLTIPGPGEDASSEDALKELEELLSEADSSLAGDSADDLDLSGTIKEPEDTEEASPFSEEAPLEVGAIDLDALDLDAELGAEDEGPEEVGAIDLDAELGAEEDEGPVELGAIDLDAVDLDVELGAEEDEGPVEVGAIDLDAVDLDAGADEGSEEGDDKADLWKKILEQADQAGSPDEVAAELDEVVAETPEEAGEDLDIAAVDGLEVSLPGGALTDAGDPDEAASAPVEAEPIVDETALLGSDSDIVAGASEKIPEELTEAAAEGLDIESTQIASSGEGTDPLDELEQALEGFEATGLDEEHEPVTGSEASAGDDDLDSLLQDDDEGIADDLDSLLSDTPVEEETAGGGLAAEMDALDEDVGAGLLEEDLGLDEGPTAAPEEPVSASDEDEAVPATIGASIGGSIQTTEDSIRFAIRGEILAAQGKHKEALRLFESLQAWAPDRASFKERVEELRRLAE